MSDGRMTEAERAFLSGDKWDATRYQPKTFAEVRAASEDALNHYYAKFLESLEFGPLITRKSHMIDKNISINIRRVGNGFIVDPARDHNCDYGVIAHSSTMVFQTMKALLAHIEAHFPPATKPSKAAKCATAK